jgi:chromosome segregation ATPase
VRIVRMLAIFAFSSGLFATGLVAGARALYQQDQSPSSTGDPVAEAARKSREQKKAAPKPKKVFTNDDVATKPAPEAPTTTNAPANSDSTTSTPVLASGSQDDASSKKEEPNSEAHWRKRFAALHRKIADCQQELDVLQRESNKADVQYYSDPQKALNEQFTRNEINEKNDKIATKQKELANLKQQLSDMEDELHRSGGDPGWAR